MLHNSRQLIHNLDFCPKASLRVALKDSSEGQSLTIGGGLGVCMIIYLVSEEKQVDIKLYMDSAVTNGLVNCSGAWKEKEE